MPTARAQLTTFGAPTQVNPYLDPPWSSVLTGSGPVGQTYAGVLPTWYGQLSSITGMFYANSRIYYTRSGQNWSPASRMAAGLSGTGASGARTTIVATRLARSSATDTDE